MYHPAADQIGFAAGGAERLSISSTGVDVWRFSDELEAPAGTNAIPAYSFVNDTNTGMYHLGTDQLGFATGGANRMSMTGSGNIGIGTTAPSAQLHTTGTVRFQNFGAGTLQTDASGNLSVSSDERLKNIQGSFDRGLADLMNIKPIEYKWKDKTGYDTENSYYGFSAQNIQLSIPEAVGEDKRGYLTLSDRPILATAINAIKEQQAQIEATDLKIKANILKTDSNIETLTQLQTSVDENLALVNQSLITIGTEQETINTQLAKNTEDIVGNTETLATISENINSLTDLTTTLVDTVDNHETRIAVLESLIGESTNSNNQDVDNQDSNPQTPNLTNLSEELQTFSDNLAVIQEEDTDEEGNTISKQIFSLSGDLIVERLKARKIKAEEIEVAGITVKKRTEVVTDKESGNKEKKEASSAGSVTVAAGKTRVIVETRALKDDSRVLITPTDDMNGADYYIEKDADNNIFTVITSKVLEHKVGFDWFILNTKD
jgi:hypothetical protein